MIGLMRMKARAVKQNRERGPRGPWVSEFRMQSGENRRLWFFGDAKSEPHYRLAHSGTKAGGRFRNITCANETDERTDARRYAEHPRCVLCIEIEAGAEFKRPSDRVAYNVGDETWVHKVPAIDRQTGKVLLRKKDKKPLLNDEPCKGRLCRLCNSKDENTRARTRAGHAVWDLSTMHCSALHEQLSAIGTFCAACWEGNPLTDAEGANATGVVEAMGMHCPLCNHDIDMAKYDPEGAGTTFVVCPGCKKKVEPEEEVVCSNNCPEARRTTIHDGPWIVTRAGERTKTSYTFVFCGVQPRPDWVNELQAADLEARFWPEMPQKLCDLVGIKVNPLRSKGTPVGGASETESYEDTPPEDGGGEELSQEEDPFASPS